MSVFGDCFCTYRSPRRVDDVDVWGWKCLADITLIYELPPNISRAPSCLHHGRRDCFELVTWEVQKNMFTYHLVINWNAKGRPSYNKKERHVQTDHFTFPCELCWSESKGLCFEKEWQKTKQGLFWPCVLTRLMVGGTRFDHFWEIIP